MHASILRKSMPELPHCHCRLHRITFVLTDQSRNNLCSNLIILGVVLEPGSFTPRVSMTLPESVDHSILLDQHILSPFPSVGPADINNTHVSFETIRTNCKYHCVPAPDETPEIPTALATMNFTIIHVNARSLLSDEKFAEFEVFLFRTKCKWSIICVSETWLYKELEDKRHIDGYTCYFDSRTEATGGGVAVFVDNDVVKKTQQLPKPFSCTQSLLIECHLINNLTILICQVYKPPNLCNNIFLEELNSSLDSIQSKNKVALMCGDFNIDLFDISKEGTALDFLNLMASAGFLPLISKSTRVQNTCHSLIDNFFSQQFKLCEQN